WCLLLRVGGHVSVRAGEPTAQARVIGKLGVEPLEHDAGFGVTFEGVERVGREPTTAEAQAWLVRTRTEPLEDLQGTCGIVSILEQRLRGPHLDRRLAWEALRGDLEQACSIPGAAGLLVELGLLGEAGEEQAGDIFGIAAADPDTAGVGVHELAAELAGPEDREER